MKSSPLKEGTPRTSIVWEKVWADDFDGSLPDTLYDFARQLERELRESQARCAELEKDAARLDWIFSTLHDGDIRERLQRVSDAHALGGLNGPIRIGDFRAAIDAALSRKD